MRLPARRSQLTSIAQRESRQPSEGVAGDGVVKGKWVAYSIAKPNEVAQEEGDDDREIDEEGEEQCPPVWRVGSLN